MCGGSPSYCILPNLPQSKVAITCDMKAVLPCPLLPVTMWSSPRLANGVPLCDSVHRGGWYGSAKSSSKPVTSTPNHPRSFRKSGTGSGCPGSGILFSSFIVPLISDYNLHRAALSSSAKYLFTVRRIVGALVGLALFLMLNIEVTIIPRFRFSLFSWLSHAFVFVVSPVILRSLYSCLTVLYIALVVVGSLFLSCHVVA